MNEWRRQEEETLGRIVVVFFVACILAAFLWSWLAG